MCPNDTETTRIGWATAILAGVTIYASSPQIPYVLRFEDCTRAEVASDIEEWIEGGTEVVADNKEILGYREVPFTALVDQGDTDDSAYIINWSQVAFVGVTETDPNEGCQSADRFPYLELCVNRQVMSADESPWCVVASRRAG